MSALHAIYSRLGKVEKLVHRALALVYRDPSWATQLAWHVDFDNGNDSANGKTHATALKTWGQLYYRLGSNYVAPFGQYVDIFLYGNNNPHDPITIDGWSCSVPRSDTIYVYPTLPNYALTQIRVHAMTPRTYYTGAFQVVQVMNFVTNTPYNITDANMKGANETPPVPPPHDQDYWYNQTIDWNGQVRQGNHDQQRIRILSGPRAGCVSWTSPGNLLAAGVPGGGANGIIRTGNFGISVPFGFTPNFATVGITALVPQAGDPYVVEDLQLLYLDRIVMKGNGDAGGSGIAFNGFCFRVVNGGDSQNPSNQPLIKQTGGTIVFVECQFDFVVSTQGEGTDAFIYFVNCSTIDGIDAGGPGFVYVDAGVHHLALMSADAATMVIDADAMLETGAIYVAAGGQAWISSAQIWDLPGHARKAGVMCQGDLGGPGTAFFFGNGSFYSTNRLWGVDQTGGGVLYNPGRAYAIAALDGGRFFYNPDVPNIKDLMTIDGHVAFFGIGLSWTHAEKAVSFDMTANPPQYTTLRSTTKALLFDTIANGGFGGRALDPETMAIIAPFTSATQPTA